MSQELLEIWAGVPLIPTISGSGFVHCCLCLTACVFNTAGVCLVALPLASVGVFCTLLSVFNSMCLHLLSTWDGHTVVQACTWTWLPWCV